MTTSNYGKEYTRENTLFSIQVWEEQQCRLLEKYLGKVMPHSIFDARKGVAAVYFREDAVALWNEAISHKAQNDPAAIEAIAEAFGRRIEELEAAWKKGTLDSREELVAFFDFMTETWIGVSVTYFLPEISTVSESYRKMGMQMRQRSADFLDNTDKVIYTTLRNLYPTLGDLVKYLRIEEIRENAIPEEEILKERERHYIYFGFNLYTGVELSEFAAQREIRLIKAEIPVGLRELKGQTAMKGVVRGTVRILPSKSEIGNLQAGEILVTAMTTPDYLPAMHKAAAFITDEGGITCHAAIVAREMKKPCIIGTKIATQVLKNGDFVEVDADRGIVKLLN